MVIAILVALGLCFGSFVNALVYRLYEQSRQGREQRGEGRAKKQKNSALRSQASALSIVRGRSMCVHCHHELAVQDLVPVLSWVWLSGKCRYCKKPISIQYPLVELATAFLFILSYAAWPSGFIGFGILAFCFWLATMVGFMALIVYDLRWMLLPNKIISPLLALAGIQVLVRVIGLGSPAPLVAAIWGVVCIAGLFYAIFSISGGKWIGGGDVKLGVVLGLLVGGPVNAFMLIFLASLLGSIVGLPLILFQKTNLKAKLPFGPFLILATIIVYLFSSVIVNWYRAHLFSL